MRNSHLTKILFPTVGLVLLLFQWPTLARSRATPLVTPIDFGISRVVASKVLAEARTINVVLPASYKSNPARRYPVLYLIDGGVEQDLLHIAGVVRLGAIWGRSSEAIVVGIETRDRRKELVGPTSDPELLKRYPTVGSSAKFREFIRAEVKPEIERAYRTNGHDAVLGESLAGLFIVETYLVEPSLFGGYAAIDPSVWWDTEALSKSAAFRLGERQRDHRLVIAFAKEQLEEPGAAKRLTGALAEQRLTPCLMPRSDQTHATIYQQVSPQALGYVLPPAQPAPPDYGFAVACSQNIEGNSK